MPNWGLLRRGKARKPGSHAPIIRSEDLSERALMRPPRNCRRCSCWALGVGLATLVAFKLFTSPYVHLPGHRSPAVNGPAVSGAQILPEFNAAARVAAATREPLRSILLLHRRVHRPGPSSRQADKKSTVCLHLQDFRRRSTSGSFSTRANAALSVGTGTVEENNCGTESQVHLVTPGLSATVGKSSWKSSPSKIHMQGLLTVVGNSAAQGRPDLEKAAVGEATVTGNGSDCKYALATSQVEMTTCARPRVRSAMSMINVVTGTGEDIEWYYSLLRPDPFQSQGVSETVTPRTQLTTSGSLCSRLLCRSPKQKQSVSSLEVAAPRIFDEARLGSTT
jgi:hypothetical protein